MVGQRIILRHCKESLSRKKDVVNALEARRVNGRMKIAVEEVALDRYFSGSSIVSCATRAALHFGYHVIPLLPSNRRTQIRYEHVLVYHELLEDYKRINGIFEAAGRLLSFREFLDMKMRVMRLEIKCLTRMYFTASNGTEDLLLDKVNDMRGRLELIQRLSRFGRLNTLEKAEEAQMKAKEPVERLMLQTIGKADPDIVLVNMCLRDRELPDYADVEI